MKSEGGMKVKSVFCDTSFFVRLLDKNDPLHKNAKEYFKYLLEKDFELILSTIALAEYCVVGNVSELPLKKLKIVAFNFDHSKKTGDFAKIVFKNKGILDLTSRSIIPNDSKLFAQAACINSVEYFISSDKESKKIFDLLKKETNLKYHFLDLNIECKEFFGMLDFDSNDIYNND